VPSCRGDYVLECGDTVKERLVDGRVRVYRRKRDGRGSTRGSTGSIRRGCGLLVLFFYDLYLDHG
jgi:hypothetical protein